MHSNIPRELLGRPWGHWGRGKTVDCVGVVIYTAKRRNLVAPTFDIFGYSRSATADSMMSVIKEFHDIIRLVIPKNNMQENDIVLMKNGMIPTHCGVLTKKHDQLHIVHSYIRAGMVVEEPLSLWKHKITHTLRFVGD